MEPLRRPVQVLLKIKGFWTPFAFQLSKHWYSNITCWVSRFVLSCGKDSTIKLWEVGSGRLIKQYLGATHTQLRCQVWRIVLFSILLKSAECLFMTQPAGFNDAFSQMLESFSYTSFALLQLPSLLIILINLDLQFGKSFSSFFVYNKWVSRYYWT